MKTLVVLIILALAALYVNAGRDGVRRRNRQRPAEVEVATDDDDCDPAAQYGWGRPRVRCRCPIQGALACLKCNICSCMGSRGMWGCTRMGCPFEIEGLPWMITNFVDSQGRERMRCTQPATEDRRPSKYDN